VATRRQAEVPGLSEENGKPLVPHLIGFGGYPRVGKDTASNILVERFGFERRAFGDLVKDGLLATDPYVPLTSGLVNRDGSEMFQLKRLSEIIIEPVRNGLSWSESWDHAKDIPEVRRLLEQFATDFGRNVLHPELWVQFAFMKMEENPSERVVFSDVRYPEESNAIRTRHGRVVRIDRPGVGPLNDHDAQRIAATRWDTKIVNDGTVEDLAGAIATVMTMLKV
jgi:hypothetical protein